MTATWRGAAVVALALGLVACGGGDSAPAPAPPAPPPGAVTLDRYLPQLGAGRWHGVLANPAGAFGGEFFTEPGRVRWGASVEHWRTRDCNGKVYAWVDAYESLTARAVYPIETVLDTVGGADLSACTDGAAFAPLDLTGPVVTEQWFKIWDATHTYWRPGYWRGEFRPLPAVVNPCQAGRALPAVELREVWWDPAAGWVRGLPKRPGALPWSDADKNPNPVAWTSGAPLPIEVESTSVETFALDAGLWTLQENGGELCQASLTTW